MLVCRFQMCYTINMKQKFLAFILLLLTGLLGAQETRPVIQFNPFLIEGIGLEESRFIESLMQSYLSDIGQVITYLGPPPARPPEAAENAGAFSARPPVSVPDYTINGNIRIERDSHILLLEIVNTRTGESYSLTSVYKSTGELVLKARSILETAFAFGGLETEKKPTAPPERISESLILGTWKGETGIEMIRLQRGGRGVAIFSSGAQMVLSYTIENNMLKVVQVSPNSERFYYPLPQEVARQIAADAEPLSWELSLYQQGTILGGVKISTGVRMENDRVAELLPNGDIREVIWTKASH